MTTTTITAPVRLSQPSQGNRLSWAVSDVMTITWRNLLALTRTPEALFFTTLQPIMFVLLFTYVFGGAIHVPGGHYIEFLMPGIFVQTVIFGAMSTAAGLSEDLHKGLIERFRALPMSRAAVLAGRTTADVVRNVFVVVLITAVGYAVGFRIGTNVALFVCGVLLILFFAYALSWGFAYIGLSAPNAETAQVMVFPLIFPLALRLVGLRPRRHHAGLAAGLRLSPTRDPGGRTRRGRSWWAASCTTPAPWKRRCCGAPACWWSWPPWQCASTARSPEASRSPTPRRCAGAARTPGRRWVRAPARSCRGRAP